MREDIELECTNESCGKHYIKSHETAMKQLTAKEAFVCLRCGAVLGRL